MTLENSYTLRLSIQDLPIYNLAGLASGGKAYSITLSEACHEEFYLC